MLSAEAKRDVLRHGSRGAATFLVEGMMGLFDGKDGSTEMGSNAEIAKLLKLPVVLVLDAGKTARSIAAVVLGFELFDPELPLAGVILNRVASDRHFRMLEAAIESACKTPVLGWLPRESAVAIPEGHLGLQTAEEGEIGGALENLIDTLADLANKHLDIANLMDLECGLDLKPEALPALRQTREQIRIGIARDQCRSSFTRAVRSLRLLNTQGAGSCAMAITAATICFGQAFFDFPR
jgi:cobyrinic acid a,c-diamide synthase